MDRNFSIGALADSAYERFEFEDIDVLVFREGSHVYAIEDLFAHMTVPSSVEDSIWTGKLNVATAHAAIKTGQALSAPAYGQVSTRSCKRSGSGQFSTQTNGASVT